MVAAVDWILMMRKLLVDSRCVERSAIEEVLRKYPIAQKFSKAIKRGVKFEVGEIILRVNDIDHVCDYSLWAKEWIACVRGHLDDCASGHVLYMTPWTCWDPSMNVFGRIESALEKKIDGYENGN